MSRIFRRLPRRVAGWDHSRPLATLALAYVDSDELSDLIPPHTLVVAREGHDLLVAG